MRVLLLHGQHIREAKSLAISHYDNILGVQDDIHELEKLHVHDVESARALLDAETQTNHDIVHVVYGDQMFLMEEDRRTVFPEFARFMRQALDNNKKLVITLDHFRIFSKRPQTKANWWYNKQIKWLNEVFFEEVIPLLEQAQLVTTTYAHEARLNQLGINNIHVIPQAVHAHDTQASPFSSPEIKMVIPGERSTNIDYNNTFALLSELNMCYGDTTPIKLHVTDQEDELVQNDSLIKLMHKHLVSQHVEFVNFATDHDDYLEQLAEYDVAVLFGKQTTNNMNDAISAGLICITSKTPENVTFKDQHNCIYTTDEPVIVGKYYVDQLINDFTHVDKMKNNMEKYRERVSPVNVRKMYELVYQPRPCVASQEIKVEGVVNVFMCCRDNQEDLGTTLSRLRVMERQLDTCEFRYYILENDSVDDTPNIIEDFYHVAAGKYVTGAQGNKKHISDPGVGRMRDMADYRNQMKSLCDDWAGSNYSFIVDSSVEFDLDIMERQLYQLLNNYDVAMITPYGVIQTSNFYYDNFAYRNLQDARDFDPPSLDTPFEAHSAFCGFVCIRTSVLERCNWDMVDGDTCEHVPFCKQVRKHGKIMIDPTVVVRWRP